MIGPPTMAPATLSRPPRITTGMTLRPKKAMAPSSPPRMPPSSTPPMAETTAAMRPGEREDALHRDAHGERHLLARRRWPAWRRRPGCT